MTAPGRQAGDGEGLGACRESDFDGHGGFDHLTAEQRLEWLAQAMDVVRDFKGLAAGDTPVEVSAARS